MNRRLFPLALSLALLAGCAPAPEPAPEPTPTPAAAVDFHTFLDAVNEKRRAVIEEGEPLDISPWTPDFADQNTTFTDGEMELLLTPHGPAENLTMEQAREDVETAFTLLRTTYGAYEYFGGDQVFDGLREIAHPVPVLVRLYQTQTGTEVELYPRVGQIEVHVIGNQGAAAAWDSHHQRVLHRVQMLHHSLPGGGGTAVRQ